MSKCDKDEKDPQKLLVDLVGRRHIASSTVAAADAHLKYEVRMLICAARRRRLPGTRARTPSPSAQLAGSPPEETARARDEWARLEAALVHARVEQQPLALLAGRAPETFRLAEADQQAAGAPLL